MSAKFLRLAAVQSLVALSRSSIYREINAGNFPAPRSLGARSVGWLESDVNEWISTRISKGSGEIVA